MRLSTPRQLIALISNRGDTGVYFFQGKEAAYYMERMARHIGGHTSNLHIYHDKKIRLEEVIVDAQQHAISGQKKVIIVKEAEKLPDLRKASGKTLLTTYLKHPAPHTLLLFSYNDKPLPAHDALAKILSQQKRLFTCPPLAPSQLTAWVEEYLAEKGYTITPKAITTLQTLADNRLNVLTRQLDKLLINLPQGSTIQESHILHHIQSTKTYTLFELQEAVSKKNINKIYTIVQELIQNPKKHPLSYTLSYLTTFFIKLLKLQHQPTTDPQRIAHNLQIHPYLTTIYLQATRHYTLIHTLHNIEHLYHADLQLKGITSPALSEAAILKELIAKLITSHAPLTPALSISQALTLIQ